MLNKSTVRLCGSSDVIIKNVNANSVAMQLPVSGNCSNFTPKHKLISKDKTMAGDQWRFDLSQRNVAA
jgi:hypothetical protein